MSVATRSITEVADTKRLDSSSQMVYAENEGLRARIARAIELAKEGRSEDAAGELREAIRLAPDHAPAHHNLAVALVEQGKTEEAVQSFRRALELRPDYGDAHCNLGGLLARLGRRQEAVEHLQHAIRLHPDNAAAHSNLGLALIELDRPAEAVIYLRQAIRLRRKFAAPYCHLAVALSKLGRMREAEEAYTQALDIDPKNIEAHTGLATLLGQLGRPAEAMACCEIALAIQPNHVTARWNRSLALLHTGDFERGWEEYEWRWKRKVSPPPKHRQPMWDGSSLKGKTILLEMEQGVGDAIQFARYIPMVKERGGKVLLGCRKSLAELMADFTGVDRLVPAGSAMPEYDVHASLMSLPRLFKTTLATIPAKVPYLSANPQCVHRWRQEFAGIRDLKIGIAWQGNRQHQWDRHRSAPLMQFEPLARVPGVRLFSLQRGFGTEQIALATDSFAVHQPLRADVPDARAWVETAAIIKNLDLVIGVDTAVAHLAGALGAPVWVALPKGCDWRWLMDREDSPWYPTMQLFRQREVGEWGPVFQRMALEVQKMVTKRS